MGFQEFQFGGFQFYGRIIKFDICIYCLRIIWTKNKYLDPFKQRSRIHPGWMVIGLTKTERSWIRASRIHVQLIFWIWMNGYCRYKKQYILTRFKKEDKKAESFKVFKNSSQAYFLDLEEWLLSFYWILLEICPRNHKLLTKYK